MVCNLIYLMAAMGHGVHGRAGAEAVEKELLNRYSAAALDLNCEELVVEE